MADSILGVESHTDITGSMLPHAELRDGQAAERQHDAHSTAALQKDAVTGVHHLLLPPALAYLEDAEGALHRDHDGAAQEDRAR